MQQINIGNSTQTLSEVEQYQAIEGPVGPVIQLDTSNIQTTTPAASPKKGILYKNSPKLQKLLVYECSCGKKLTI